MGAIDRVLAEGKVDVAGILRELREGRSDSMFGSLSELDSNYALAMHRFSATTRDALETYPQERIDDVVDSLVAFELISIFEIRGYKDLIKGNSEKMRRLDKCTKACEVLLKEAPDEYLLALKAKYEERRFVHHVAPLQAVWLLRENPDLIFTIEHGKNRELTARNALIVFLFKTLKRKGGKGATIELVTNIYNSYFGFKGMKRVSKKIVENLVLSK